MSGENDGDRPVMVMLTREAILQSNDIDYEIVDVPEWGGSVRVKSMTGTERDAFEQSMMRMRKGVFDGVSLDNIRAKLCTMTMVNGEGELLFSGAADAEWLGQKSAAALDRVYTVAQKLSRLTKEDIDELTGNSESNPNADSGLSSL